MQEGVFCFILCFGFATAAEKSVPIDTYCTNYQQVVLTKDEVGEVLKLPRKIRDRIQGNELEYLCRCQGWKLKPEKKTVCTSIAP